MIKIITLNAEEIESLPRDAEERRLAILALRELPLSSTIETIGYVMLAKSNRIQEATFKVTIPDDAVVEEDENE